MEITIENITAKFREYNKLYFNNELFLPKIKTTETFKFVGYFSCRKFIGNRRIQSPCIEVSTYFEMTEEQFRDIMVHEMIHFYLAYKHIDHELTHGDAFLHMAQEINEKFGLNVTAKASDEIKRKGGTPLLSYLWLSVFG